MRAEGPGNQTISPAIYPADSNPPLSGQTCKSRLPQVPAGAFAAPSPSPCENAILRRMTTSPITIQVPDELAGRLRERAGDLPRLLELGLREMDARTQLQFDGAADVLEFLTGLPTPEEVLALRPSPALQARITDYLDRNRAGDLSADDEQEWEQIEYLEHLVRMAKAKALLKSRE